MIIYLLQVSFCWIGFYMLFHLFLRRETFFDINRWYLLGALLIGLVIPLLGSMVKEVTHTYPIDAGPLLYTISETPAYIESSVLANSKTYGIAFLIKIIYWLGFAVLTIKFALGLAKIYRLYRNSRHENHQDFQLIITHEHHLPFSFFSLIFISELVPLKKGYNKMIRHELTHIQQWHTLDIILVEILNLFFWFNPILIIYKKALRQSHEYQADAMVVKQSDPKRYGSLLLSQSRSGLELHLTHQFFHSQLKNRIAMMHRKRSHKSALYKYCTILPIFVLSLFLFSNSSDPINDPEPFKKEVKDAIRQASSIEDLRNKVWNIIQEHRDTGTDTRTDIDQYLREIGRETGIYIEFYFDRNLNFSYREDVAKKNGYLTDAIRLFKMPPIYTKLEDVLKEARPHWPLLKINGNLLHGHFTRIDPERIAAQSYTPPEEAKKIHGDIAFGGVINLTLKDFDPSELPVYGTLVEANPKVKTNLEIERKVDVLARFPGCEDIEGIEADKCALENFNAYIAEMMHYPKEAKQLGIEGTVMVRFVVSEYSSIGQPEVIHDIGGGCGEEALYLIQNMNYLANRWQPAMKNGKKVNSIVTLPVKFSLEGMVTKKEFSARNASYIGGETERSIPEILEDPGLTREMVALLEDFEISPRPLFIVDGKLMEKDSIFLRPDQIQRVKLLDEDQAAEKYEAVNQRALEITTGPQVFEVNAEKESWINRQANDQKLDDKIDVEEVIFLEELELFPNPAKYFIHVSFMANKEPLELRIHDLAGKLLHRELFPEFDGKFNQTIYNEKFVNGEGILSIVQGDKIQAQKIIFAK